MTTYVGQTSAVPAATWTHAPTTTTTYLEGVTYRITSVTPTFMAASIPTASAPTTTTSVGGAIMPTNQTQFQYTGASGTAIPTTYMPMGISAQTPITVSAEVFEKAKVGSLTLEEINQLLGQSSTTMAAMPVDTTNVVK